MKYAFATAWTILSLGCAGLAHNADNADMLGLTLLANVVLSLLGAIGGIAVWERIHD